MVEPERIADEPVFCAPLPERMAFPNACAVCGARPTLCDEAIGRQLNTAKLLVGKLSTTKVTLDRVPYCDAHAGGVDLDTKHIRFRSYPYMRAFCDLYGLTPGHANSFWDELDACHDEQAAASDSPPEPIPVAELVDEALTRETTPSDVGSSSTTSSLWSPYEK